MNLTTLKASAELAKTSQQERDNWGEDIDPDDVLRLVEVALAADAVVWSPHWPFTSEKDQPIYALCKAMEGIEP